MVYALKDFKPAQISLSLVVVGETSAIENGDDGCRHVQAAASMWVGICRELGGSK